ncbi:MAG TPA: lactonase family protein, partial [Thermoanaerobaculia bacterium]|nr:lactonase family protein [Thermoanaerobaculia bacterium]
GASRGIYRFEFDTASGAGTDPVLAGESENPSFLALHPGGRVLYAVNELKTFGGAATGAVSAFAIDGATGNLAPLNQQASGGADPCHLVVDRSGGNVLVANYSGGSVAVLPLAVGGRLRPATVVLRHAGTGPDRERQEAPHAHAILLDPAERFALAADLGADRIFVYRFGAVAGSLEPNDPAGAAIDPGSGPRHLAWHPSGTFLYALNELTSTVTAFRYDAGRGALESFQTITTLPAGFSGRNLAAEIAVSPDGRFLYASNRGDDSLAVFGIDAASGALAPAGRDATGGRAPRHFAIEPSGRWLLAANQDSDSVTVFRLEPATGRPVMEGRPLAIPKPVCLLFAPRPR